jgi:hypothetical protein
MFPGKVGATDQLRADVSAAAEKTLGLAGPGSKWRAEAGVLSHNDGPIADKPMPHAGFVRSTYKDLEDKLGPSTGKPEEMWKIQFRDGSVGKVYLEAGGRPNVTQVTTWGVSGSDHNTTYRMREKLESEAGLLGLRKKTKYGWR